MYQSSRDRSGCPLCGPTSFGCPSHLSCPDTHLLLTFSHLYQLPPQEGPKMKSGKVLTLVAAAVLIFTAAALADQFRMRAGESNPAATGVIHANTDRNGNVAMELEAKHLAPPARLTPPHSTYVVLGSTFGQAGRSTGRAARQHRRYGRQLQDIRAIPQLRHLRDCRRQPQARYPQQH